LEIVKAEEGGLTEEAATLANQKKVHLDYAVIRYGDFSTLGSFCQLSSFILSRVMELIIQSQLILYSLQMLI